MSVRARKPVTTVVTKAAAYDTIIRPIITEKATMANEHGQVTFAVASSPQPSHKSRQQLKCFLMSRSLR